MMSDFNMMYGVEVTLKDPEDFLVVKETLTRIGVPANKSKTLFQSCLILHKREKYYIIHFKEMFALDGKVSDADVEDIQRRNLIAKLLQDWNLVDVVNKTILEDVAPMSAVKIISFKDKSYWQQVSKYTLGTPVNHI